MDLRIGNVYNIYVFNCVPKWNLDSYYMDLVVSQTTLCYALQRATVPPQFGRPLPSNIAQID